MTADTPTEKVKAIIDMMDSRLLFRQAQALRSEHRCDFAVERLRVVSAAVDQVSTLVSAGSGDPGLVGWGFFRPTFSRLSVAESVARPASFARENVKLAYATKVRRVQGPTVNMADGVRE